MAIVEIFDRGFYSANSLMKLDILSFITMALFGRKSYFMLDAEKSRMRVQ